MATNVLSDGLTHEYSRPRDRHPCPGHLSAGRAEASQTPLEVTVGVMLAAEFSAPARHRGASLPSAPAQGQRSGRLHSTDLPVLVQDVAKQPVGVWEALGAGALTNTHNTVLLGVEHTTLGARGMVGPGTDSPPKGNHTELSLRPQRGSPSPSA